MSKRTSLLGGLAKAAAALAPNLTLDAKLAAARDALAQAISDIDKFALEFERQVPGAGERLSKAQKRSNETRDTIARLEAAQRASAAEDAAKQAQARAAAEGKADKALQADWDKLAAVAAEGEPILAAYAEWYERLIAQHSKAVAGLPLNPRARQDLGQFSFYEAVRQDLAHLTETNVPGANPLARSLSDAATRQTLAAQLADLASAVLPNGTKRRAA